jgi:hypothetical protein
MGVLRHVAPEVQRMAPAAKMSCAFLHTQKVNFDYEKSQIKKEAFNASFFTSVCLYRF